MRYFALFFVFFISIFSAEAQTAKPKASKPALAKPSVTAAKKQAAAARKPDEKTAWEKASKTEDPAQRIDLLAKFNDDFPKSTYRNDSLVLLATTRAELGNTKLVAGDARGAIPLLKDAAAEAPSPIPDQLWNELLSKIPANLYFRGARDEAYAVAASLEAKSGESVLQSLALANFYLTVEDGSAARRVAERVVGANPASSAGYQALALSYRIDFKLDESAVAYAKALELEPGSLIAKRGLAEARRSLDKSDDAVTLYREILEKEPGDVPAQTGLVLALFDVGKRTEAETELAKAISANENNVILLAGAAYWYAAHGYGDRAIELAQKAIAADPRYIWSHIALARGLMLQKKPVEAEKALFTAQRYGNFPTVQYEMAAARLAAGYYRDAASELAKSFSVKDGVVSVKLGGRVPREGKDMTEIIGYERRASIFTPTAADDPDSSAKLAALLEFTQTLDATEPNADAVSSAADKFVSGDDKMKVYRQLYAAGELLEQRVALPKVIELTAAATAGVDQGIDTASAPTAVMAPAIYDIRASSMAQGQYVNVPDIPKNTMSTIVRGEIEMLSGWAAFQMNKPEDAVIKLKRGLSVLPPDSYWSRLATWRLGASLVAAGREAEGLDAYIKAYKSAGTPDPLRYTVIEGVYRRLNGNTDGLEAKVGPNPNQTVARVEPPVEASPTRETKVPDPVPTPDTTPAAGDSAPVQQLPAGVPAALPSPSPAEEETKQSSPKPTPEQPSIAESKPEEKLTMPSAANERPAQSDSPIKPCSLTLSEESIVLPATGKDLAVVIGSEGDVDLDPLTGNASSPGDISVNRQIVVGIKTKALFVLRSATGKPGNYSVLFEMPCGKKEVIVTVK
jgi:tetratricopeptide (TPR) repeat protein